MEKDFWIKSHDDESIFVKKWYKEAQQPKAIIQIAHGMVEHIRRYGTFSHFLLNQNIFVYGNDHRGHGQTGEKQGLFGYLSDKEGFTKTALDLYEVTKQIKQDYPNTPIILFGHSMGSFLTRKYIQHQSDAVNGVILSGTGFHYGLRIKTAKALASILPPKEKSKLMNSLVFGTYNKRIAAKKTGFDWLSSDEKAIQEYINDPHTGFIPTARFFYDLMTGLEDIHNKKRNAFIRKDLPMLIISGDADPVGDYSKGVWKTAHLFRQAGLSDITTMLFENGRHELLSEGNKEEVFSAIFKWIQTQL
ncbi:alpha/beta hydrolase [Virgibacillus alimentarius]|uniref:Alpha-beta hydrolase superfamily lysophospholipase n=1 Tax=Virgibacillus alimentarius TaxID=698769 RepID=A0ABS4S627_9BACI|nr:MULTISPECIES: alpha/beta hydrolase [Virgibacillus]MBP2256869.1 alpha-beta hydrolase superfamily lysophospholipase [Virgibacillus alimentarius]HLR69551.1 lysophospholipase [Virgibacillus sp.]